MYEMNKRRDSVSGKKTEEKINDALLKVALGYQVAEVTEEYADVDGELKLTKRKKTKKDVPPDLKAVQMLLATEDGGDFSDWSDEKLEKEKLRLIAVLQENATKADGVGERVKEPKTEKSAAKRTRRKSVRKTTKRTTKK